MKKCFALIFFIALSISAIAKFFHTERFTTENGLPSNGIKGMFFDRYGFLWIGTEGGIVRYDGMNFKVFTINNSPIESDRISRLIKSTSGNIFSQDERGGIVQLQANKLERIFTLNGVNRSHESLFGLYSSKTLLKKNIAFPPFEIDFSIVPIDSLHFLFYSFNKIYSYNPEENNFTFLDSLPGELFSIDKQIFLRYKNHVTKFSIENRKITDRTIYNFPFEDGTIQWAAGDEKVLFVKGNSLYDINFTNDFTAQLICDSLPRNIIIKSICYVEELKKIFIGTKSKGLYIISIPRIATMSDPAKNGGSTSVYSQYLLPNGNIITSSGTVYGKAELTDLPFDKETEHYLYTDTNGSLWFTAKGEIINYDPATKRKRKVEGQHGGLTSFCRVWKKLYAVQYCGVGVIEDIQNRLIQTQLYPFPNHEKITLSFNVEADQDSNLLLATCDGLIRFNSNEHSFDTLLTIPNICVRAISKYKDYFFIGTYGGGAFLMRGNKLVKLPPDYSSFNNYSHAFVVDTIGQCWISTNRGLLRVSVRQLLAYFDDETSPVYYRYYGLRDGMENTEMNGGCYPASITLKDGTFSFPTMDGLVLINPYENETHFGSDSIIVDHISVNGKTIPVSSFYGNTISNDFKNLQISLLTTCWNQSDILIQYKISENDSWRTLNASGPLISLDYLRPGNYNIVIRKIKLDDSGNFKVIRIPFTVDTPWYQTRASVFIIIILLIAFALFVYRLMALRQIKKREELEKIIKDKTEEIVLQNEELALKNKNNNRVISILSHDFIAPLKSINMTSRNLLTHYGKLDKSIHLELLNEVVYTTNELQELSRNIVDWIKYQKKEIRLIKEEFSLDDLILDTIHFCRSISTNNNLSIEYEPKTSPVNVKFYPAPLKVILYNLIQNSIKNTASGAVYVRSDKYQKGFSISVRDTGNGMDEDQINRLLNPTDTLFSLGGKGSGLGYHIIHDLLKLMKGKLEIKSIMGTGSIVTISFSEV